MKVFVFGGNAQLALAKPVITLSPLDPTEETPSEWDGLLFPPQGAKVFLGSIVNIGVQIYEYDTMEMGGSKVEIPFGGDTATATLTVENATFEDGKNTATMTLQRVYGGLYTKQAVKPLVRVKIPETWSGDVKVSCLVVDPGNDPASVTLLKESKMYEFKGKLADKDLKLSATWSMVPADAKLPETVTGVSGKYRPILPFFEDILQEYKPFGLWDKQTARDMRIVYKYGPDLTIDNSANYYGIPVQEKFDKYTTSHKSMDVSIIRSDIMALYPGPGWKFDEIYNKWESDSGYSTFSIGIQDVGVDCTEDTYKSPNSENIALDFLKEMPGLGDDVSVSRVQRYYCKGKEIEGDMPVEVISLYEPFDNNGGATLKQQVKPQ